MKSILKKKTFQLFLARAVVEYSKIINEPHYQLPKPIKSTKIIHNYSDTEIQNTFGLMNQNQLLQLFNALQFQEIVRYGKRHIINGETLFLFCLRKLKYPITYAQLIIEFGGEQTQWSKCFNWFIKHLESKFSNLIIGSLEYWRNDLQYFAHCIKTKIINTFHLDYLRNYELNAFGFIDNTIFRTCRPSKIHSEEDNIDIRAYLIQRAFYNGWKHYHGIKIQLVSLPNGIIADMSDVFSARHSDSYTLIESNLDKRLHEM